MSKLSTAVQEGLLAILCFDATPGGAKFVRALLPARSYDAFYRDVAESAEAYLERYGEPAGTHLFELIETLKSRLPEKAQFYDRIFASLQTTWASFNRTYILDEAVAFSKRQRLNRGIQQAITEMRQDTAAGVVAAESALQLALKDTHTLFDPGVLFTDASKSMRFLSDSHAAFPCGIPQLDLAGLGPSRKTLHLFSALPKRGKSWWLLHLAKQAVTHGLKPLYITLEMSEDLVCKRAFQSFFSLTKRQLPSVNWIRFERDDLGRFVSLDDVLLENRPAISDDNAGALLRERLLRLKHRPSFRVKQFPTGELTIRDLDAYLDGLEGSCGFIPDLLIVDYADLMKIDSKNLRADTGRVYKELRGLAVRRNLALATATQSGRSGMNARTIDEGHVSEDWSKIAICDIYITYSQTPEEKQLGLARLFVAVGREDHDKFTTLISQSYPIGQFCMDSVGMVSSYWDHVQQRTAVAAPDDHD